jgi:hypothetical protein
MLIDNAEPTDRLAVLQPHLLGGIHLPEVMGMRRSLRVGLRATAFGSRSQARRPEPALEGAGAGES